MTKPNKVWMVMTFGAGSALTYGPYETFGEANGIADDLRAVGGDPSLYECFQYIGSPEQIDHRVGDTNIFDTLKR